MEGAHRHTRRSSLPDVVRSRNSSYCFHVLCETLVNKTAYFVWITLFLRFSTKRKTCFAKCASTCETTRTEQLPPAPSASSASTLTANFIPGLTCRRCPRFLFAFTAEHTLILRLRVYCGDCKFCSFFRSRLKPGPFSWLWVKPFTSPRPGFLTCR